jgi:tetratricopeptide (TPR) repeat protein
VGLGRYEEAARTFEQVLAMSHDLDDRLLEADAFNGLGEVLVQTGELDKAREHHATALRLASEAASPRAQARAHSGLARTCDADGASVQARHHWQEALDRYETIGAPEASEIRARLATTSDCLTE